MDGAPYIAPPQREKVDGRVERAKRTRRRMAAAVRVLIDRGVARPTAQQIAKEAGVSTRSIFQHYESVAALRLAAMSGQQIVDMATRLRSLDDLSLVRALVSGEAPRL